MQIKKIPKWLLLGCLMVSFFFQSTSLGAYAEENQEYGSNGGLSFYGEYKFEEEPAGTQNTQETKELPRTSDGVNQYVDRGEGISSLPATIPKLGDTSYVRAKIFGQLALGMIGYMIVRGRKKGVQT